MERHKVLDMMRTLRLSGMRAAYDEIVAQGIKREHPIQRVVGDLLKLEIADKEARSIKYQLTFAKLTMVKELADFHFASSPVNEALVRDLATGEFLGAKRNLVLVAGTGKKHLSVAIARACIRNGARARCFNVVDLVNHLQAEARDERHGRTANRLARRAWSFWTNWAICPSPRPADSCCSI